MTCIVGMIGRNNDRVIIGTDDICITGRVNGFINISDNQYVKKVWKLREDSNYIFAGSGDVLLINKFKDLTVKFPESKPEDRDLNKRDIERIIYYYESELKDKDKSCSIMIGYKNKIFIVDIKNDEYIVDEISKWNDNDAFKAIGAGKLPAEASLLYNSKYIKEADDYLVIGRSIQVASELCSHVKPPIYLVTNAHDTVFEFIDYTSMKVNECNKQIEKV